MTRGVRAALLSAVLVGPGGAGAQLVTTQIVRDGSVGPDASLQINPVGSVWEIGEAHGERPGGGPNLFHSFETFDVGRFDTARFTAAPVPTDNVISRVTGGNPSSIYGTIRSAIPGADFYFLNPSGIMFGADASLDIEGSFHASTAESLQFSNGEVFEARQGGSVPILATATPTEFGFLGPDAASIVLDGSVLVGLDGISLSAGDVELRNGAAIATTTFGAEPPKDIDIVASRSITLSGTDADGVGAALVTIAGSNGDGGSIRLEAAAVRIEDGGFVFSLVDGGRSGGDISIVATERLTLSDTGGLSRGGSVVATLTLSRGDAGSIDIRAPIVEIGDGGSLASSTEASGAAGQVSVVATESVSLSGKNASDLPSTIVAISSSVGDPGSISIEAPVVSVGDGAFIGANPLAPGARAAGEIEITASERVTLSGTSEFGGFGLGSALLSFTTSGADSGSIRVNAPLLELQDGALINVSTSGTGAGGDIRLDVGELRATGGSEISAQSAGLIGNAGDAGSIVIGSADADHPTRKVILTDSRIATSAFSADGGDISLAVSDQVLLERGSEITASVAGGTGGNVTIGTPQFVVLRDASSIIAQARALGGSGGAIEITSDAFVKSLDSVVDASAPGGPELQGTVVIRSPEVDLESGLTPLSTPFLDASALLRPSCAARASAGREGSFVVAQRRGQALETRAQSAGLAEEADEPLDEVRALSNAVLVALEAGEIERAADLLNDAYARARSLAATREKIPVLIRLADSDGRMATAAPRRRESSLLRARAALGEAVELARGLGDERSLSYALGALGGLYRSEHRVGEALYLTREALRVAERADAPESIYRWHWQAGQILWAQGRAGAAIESYRRAVAVLEETRQDTLARSGSAAAYFRRAVAPAYLDLVDALLQTAGRVNGSGQRNRLLAEARATMEQLKAAELRDYFRDECVAELEAKVASLEEVSGTAAVIYPILLPDRTELLVTLPSGLERTVVPVGAAQLTAEVRDFRRELVGVTRKHLRSGRTLYDWLVRPLEAELAAAGIETLVFVPDGPLRTIPMAALHDGERFLIERYGVAVTPGFELVDPRPLDRSKMDLLLAGLSESVQGYPPLPSVPAELSAVKSIYGGEVLLDREFVVGRVERAMREDQPSVVHIASHGEFTGDPATSFLLTYDGKLTMDRLHEVVGVAKFREEPLALLVLSACETAAGDDRAALGLAGLAIRAGARSALGSLWAVSDEATSELVREFYGELEDESVSKAEALQRAQRKLLASARFGHPRYWSPFVIISNWL